MSSRLSTSFAEECRVHFGEVTFRRHCFSLWEMHLEWLNSLGFTRALDRCERFERLPYSGHEVVELLQDFIERTHLVNAHLGLTSSDIVDNVYLLQVDESLETVARAVNKVIAHIYARADARRDTTGFTHWQPASRLSWEHRTGAWLEPLRWAISTRPCIHAKAFGGPVGDAAAIKLLAQHLNVNLSDHPFDWPTFGLAHPRSRFPLQSSDFTCELEAVAWCTRVAAQLYKIAQDLRFLASHGYVALRHDADNVGSSSMPHKCNPFRWEKVCSMCRVVMATHAELLQVASLNSLERTLDTSWQLKSLLPRCFVTLAGACDAMLQQNFTLTDRGSFTLTLPDSDSENLVLGRVLTKGEDRWTAYRETLKLLAPARRA